MGWRPENRNSAWDFLQKYSPVAFRTDRRISLATGEWRFRVGLPQKKFSGRISSRRRIAISSGTSSHITFVHLFSNAQRMAMSHETSAPRLLQSRLMPPENGDFVWDFLEKQILVPSPATEGGKGHSELKCATFRGSTKRCLVKCRSALFNLAGGYENDAGESSASRSTP